MSPKPNFNIKSLLLTEVIKVENEEEQLLLDQFKVRVHDTVEDDQVLLRFMRAREYDLDKGEEMLRKYISWRKENEMSKILEWNVPQLIKEFLPYNITGRDSVGAPVIYIPIGTWKGRELVEKGMRTELLKFGAHLLESVYILYKEVGYKPCHLLLEMEGLSLYQVTHLETMRTIFAGFQMMESNYPEALKRIQIINAPWVFAMAFNFIKPILSPHTCDKIQVYGSNSKQWLPEVLKHIPEEFVPTKYLS